MTTAMALKTYRQLTLELMDLEAQLSRRQSAGGPRCASSPRLDGMPRGTNHPTAALVQLCDGLDALAVRKRRERDALRPLVESALQSIANYRLLLIVQHYYVLGETDEQAAEAMHLSDRYVNRIRNAYLRSVENTPATQECTFSAHTDTMSAQRSASGALS